MNALNQVSSPIYLVPAYGRIYSTAETATADWKAGKDFKIANGPYCSIRDIECMNAGSIYIDIITAMVRV